MSIPKGAELMLEKHLNYDLFFARIRLSFPERQVEVKLSIDYKQANAKKMTTVLLKQSENAIR